VQKEISAGEMIDLALLKEAQRELGIGKTR
jgi:hypothetical protein